MKIAIISDSHDNIPNIEKFLAWAKINQIEMLIHCGDIAAPAMVSKLLVPNFFGPIHLVHGNVSDRAALAEVCRSLTQVKLHGDQGELMIDSERSGKIKIAFCHFPETARALAASGQYALVFYGHSHKPWLETLANHCQLINPGTLGGLFQKPTFAVYDSTDDNLVLKILEDL